VAGKGAGRVAGSRWGTRAGAAPTSVEGESGRAFQKVSSRTPSWSQSSRGIISGFAQPRTPRFHRPSQPSGTRASFSTSPPTGANAPSGTWDALRGRRRGDGAVDLAQRLLVEAQVTGSGVGPHASLLPAMTAVTQSSSPNAVSESMAPVSRPNASGPHVSSSGVSSAASSLLGPSRRRPPPTRRGRRPRSRGRRGPASASASRKPYPLPTGIFLRESEPRIPRGRPAWNDWMVHHGFPRTPRRSSGSMLIDRIRWVDGWPVVGDLGQPSSEPRRCPNV
jgi:hypothetical protein